MRKTVVLDVIGLTPDLIGEHTPKIKAFMERGKMATMEPEIPAVTTTAQATFVTGTRPNQHGVVGNGWYFRDMAEIKFWRQSNKLVQARKIWEHARELNPDFTVSKMFWWYNMYSSADYSATPRPMYPSDGRKIPDVYTYPMDMRDRLQAELGQFPLFKFWGPTASIESSRWIADATMMVDKWHDPTLTLVYLPHMDYGLQKYGLDIAKVGGDLREIDDVTGDLISYYEKQGAEVIVLSEYGIVDVNKPIHLNRLFREHGLIAYRMELGHEMMDAGASKAFAVADHQIAHVYVNDPSVLDQVRELLEGVDGVAQVLDADGKRANHLDHERTGDFVVLAEPNAWFTYYFWLDDAVAPDFARTVDIHQKPGYDPVELFVDPEIPAPKLKAGLKLLQKKLGFRYLMDLIPLDATLVKGSHGVKTARNQGPVFITNNSDLLPSDHIEPTDVYTLMLRHLTADKPEAVAAS
jgi:predicted AlkP superfamily pyrophosphatase or phosphodiesterase